MAERINRRELIVQTAANLFSQQGYAATSVRQIAETVGCSEAALYYHFKEGKRALLQAVIEDKTPTFLTILENCKTATSLPDLILKFGQNAATFCEVQERHIQWLTSEFPSLSQEEQALFHAKHIKFHDELAKLISPFVENESETSDIAWILICGTFGYRQIFIGLELCRYTDFSIDKFIKNMIHCIINVHENNGHKEA